ncbi:MAG: DUF2971 domain-containing protein [Defluviitaleaceae bacterium]|nr:DUF2971 domain-containing protein [Defluviitaleaceae bacterium]
MNKKQDSRAENFANYRNFMEKSQMPFNLDNLGVTPDNANKGAVLASLISMCYPKNESLFRYRRATDDNIQALENNHLWFSAADTFNDVYDSLCYINIEKLLNAVFKILPPHNLSYSKKISISKEYVQTFENLGKTRKIVCLTEDITSNLMWAHYAEKGSGFAVEYKINAITEFFMKSNFRSPIPYPVIYDDARYDITNDAIDWFRYSFNKDKGDKTAVNPIDGLISVKSTIRKGLDWKYEKEWRIIDISDNFEHNVKHDKLSFISPSAVYIGYSTEKYHEEKICSICESKSIPVFKMTLDKSSGVKLNYEPL